ncbi:PREDICTED: mitogen-activated protein kinase kinase kinase A-like [Ipomoea nil]|uniref:mitogen-activated protein kinase kinase kinase A-like n=1 Tax=Ipomoea nil TaxID=35883 RepID=UPI00090197F9|nr:PREDICTED: mitogen-activated protein kinase kinase kinase A-like [Ipomoea nil]
MEWIRGPTIGRGSSATVSLATAAGASGHHFAVKSAHLSSSGMLQREKDILSQFDSPYVVKCLGCDISCEHNNALYNLFLEYVPGGTLSDLAKRGRFSEPMIQFYAHQILMGIGFLHSMGFVHCDIKGQNILVSEDCSAVKIADLGCGKFLENGEASSSSAFSGTPAFMAPEVAKGEEQGFPADIWAFGCTVIEMATGSAPWQDMNDPVSALYRIANSGDVPEFPRWFSDDAKEFLGKCLDRDAKRRWTAAELLQHPFLQSISSNSVTFKEFVRNSPTSVMDQAVWNSIEMSQPSCNSTATAGFPANRIGRLIIQAGERLPDWEEDGGWVTVRGNEEDESTDSEPILISILCPEDLESSIVNEAPSFDSSDDEISVNDRVNPRTNLDLSCHNFTDAFVSWIQDFDDNILKTSFSSKALILFTPIRPKYQALAFGVVAKPGCSPTCQSISRRAKWLGQSVARKV